MVNTKFQHRTPFILPTKVTLKLAELHHLLTIYHWQTSLPLFSTLSNEHIALRYKTQHLRNKHAKMCKHYSHCYFSGFYFCPPLSTPSSQAYTSWGGSNNFPFSVYLGERTVKYSSQDPPSQKKVSLALCKLWDIRSSVHYCTEGDVKKSYSKISSLTRLWEYLEQVSNLVWNSLFAVGNFVR